MIEAEVPDAAYWSFHLYADDWFEVPDRETRMTTRNHTQTCDLRRRTDPSRRERARSRRRQLDRHVGPADRAW